MPKWITKYKLLFQSLHRTYVPVAKKRKRRKVCHDFVVMDLSEDDDSDREASHEQADLNGSAKKKPKSPHKKKRRKNAEESDELKEFISEFNSMVDEVNEYKLTVEQSTIIEDDSWIFNFMLSNKFF